MRSAGGRFNRDMSNVRYVSNLIPAPPICNRVASGWKKPEIGCHCHLWPNFIQSNLDKTHLARTAFRCIDSDGMEGDVYAGRSVSFWRPGAQKTKGWYNGEVESLQDVQFPSGKRALVLGINWNAFGISEGIHYVSPELDMRFKEYYPNEFDASAMQMHTNSRRLKDPNTGLARR